MIAIRTHELTKKYKDLVAVDKLNLTINEGELFSLLGEKAENLRGSIIYK